jgi:D-arabinose 1-dehydrogenase-like Zn-dependent alcohol dehydrogenase
LERQLNDRSITYYPNTLRCAELTGVRPMIETYPLERAGEAYARMMSGLAQFRVVLTM